MISFRNPELLTRRREFALRLGGRPLPLARRRRSDSRDLGLERLLALAHACGEPFRLGALAHGSIELGGRAALGGLRLGKQFLNPKPLGSTRPRASSTTSASRPSRSAIWSACDVPGRPSATR